MEQWKEIVDYPAYQVSNCGRIKRSDAIRKPGLMTAGYHFISLWKNNKQKLVGVHRLVAQAFID